MVMNKKGQVNNITYLIIILAIMMTVAVALPYIQRDLVSGSGNQGINSSITYNNVTGILPDDTTTPIGLIDIFVSVVKMLFWYYGTLPVALEVFFVGLKIVFWILLYRLFVPTTGG